jgi:hypothetical protein
LLQRLLLLLLLQQYSHWLPVLHVVVLLPAAAGQGALLAAG